MFISDIDSTPFPEKLVECGLNEEFLEAALIQERDWCVKDGTTVGFYRCLHKFLLKWPKSRFMTKTSIGRFYIRIDRSLRQKGSRPDNIYQFVEKIVLSDEPACSHMSYGVGYQQIHLLRKELKEHDLLIKSMASKLTETDAELDLVKRKLCSTETERDQTVKNATKKVISLERKNKAVLNSKLKAIESYEHLYQDHTHYEEELLEQNSHLSKYAKLLVPYLPSTTEASSLVDHSQMIFHTIDNGQYTHTPALRALYYQLLADQVPLGKIKTTIKAVIKCFFPLADVENLQLPSESCAKYMRQHELKTVSMVHKAKVLSEANSFHLNSDGTTKFQRKIGGTVFNGLVISVNELPDGSAESMIADMSREIEKLRDIARVLKIPNADKINWTLVSASTSDSASTQKKFNQLLEKKREEDESVFGPVNGDAVDIIENFCAMHLGINLRKAFLEGLKTESSCSSNASERREYYQTDTLVHEFCKLFGRHGVPEYGCGASSFLDFLNLMLNEQHLSADQREYYTLCSKTFLDRQVGSRYFVTAHNAGKILFLISAACDFLEYCGKSTDGNKLERDVYNKLQDTDEISKLKADALIFHHVYADLMTLAKSTALSKSAWDMNMHYLELSLFLAEIEKEPQAIMCEEMRVFPSEDRLYGSEMTNHRVHSKYSHVEKRLFQTDSFDDDKLFPLIASGVSAMKKKLGAYAKNQLPNGIYWDPEAEVKEILKKLPPTNDICESLLGLNDHLTTSIPNLSQLTRSNLIETKKNKTMLWLRELPQEERDQVVTLAAARRARVKTDSKEEQEFIKAQRTKKLYEQKQRRDALKKRTQEELMKLGQLQLITSATELRGALADIEESSLSAAKKRDKKLSLLKDQINIRKKVYKQEIKIPLSQRGKKRPLATIAFELLKFMETQEPSGDHCCHDPASLVGKSIEQKFEVDVGEFEWFRGFVVSYDTQTNLHEVAYEDEDEHCHFNLLEDLIINNLRIT